MVSASPLYIQSSKSLAWLIERKVINHQYRKELADLLKKFDLLLQDLPELTKSIDAPSSYLKCLGILEEIQKVDTKTDMFGRPSATVRAWKDLIASFKKNNIFLGELSESLNEIASSQAPRLKSIIADCKKVIIDLEQKVQDLMKSVSIKEMTYKNALNSFSIEDEHIRLRLLEKAHSHRVFLDSYQNRLSELQPLLDLYAVFRSYTCNKLQENSNVCQALHLLITNKDVLLYTLKHGQQPKGILNSDCPLAAAIEQERSKVSKLQKNQTDSEISWDDVGSSSNQIDFSGLNNIIVEDGSDDEELTLGIEFGVDEENLTSDKISPQNSSEGFATGDLARPLLDSVEGRRAVLAELEELQAFVKRLIDEQDESVKSNKLTHGDTSNSATGTICQFVMQNAPKQLQSISNANLNDFYEMTSKFLNELKDPTVTQLCLLRCRPAYLDRLVERLADQARQVEVTKRRVAEAEQRSKIANDELVEAGQNLARLRKESQTIVQAMESELGVLFKREVKLIGQVLEI